MLFQMLAGVLPFRGDSMAELMYKIANEEAPDIRIIRAEISPALADVVALSLSKRPEIRYQSGDIFAADLRSVLQGMAPVLGSVAPVAPARVGDVAEKTTAFAATVPAGPADFERTAAQVVPHTKAAPTAGATDLDI